MRTVEIDDTIYQIESDFGRGAWGVFDVASVIGREDPERRDKFSASGKVWQAYGIHAVHDHDYALKVLQRIREERDVVGWNYRVIKRRIVQTVEVWVESHWDKRNPT